VVDGPRLGCAVCFPLKRNDAKMKQNFFLRSENSVFSLVSLRSGPLENRKRNENEQSKKAKRNKTEPELKIRLILISWTWCFKVGCKAVLCIAQCAMSMSPRCNWHRCTQNWRFHSRFSSRIRGLIKKDFNPCNRCLGEEVENLVSGFL
jgi:hypothetical protein